MGHVEQRTNGVGEGVDGGDRCVGEGLPGEHGAEQHFAARAQITAVFHGTRQPLGQQQRCLPGEAVRQRVLAQLGGIGLDRVHHRVDAGVGGDVGRQARRQPRVQHRAIGVEDGVDHTEFDFRPTVTMAMGVTSEPVPAVVGT